MTGCPFCDRFNTLAFDPILSALPDGPPVIAFEPLSPVVPGHLLVVPGRHIRDAADDPVLAGRVLGHAAALVKRFGIQANIITSIGPDATQTVFHLHVHIVPRKAGDGLALPWTAQQRAAGSAGPTVAPKRLGVR